MSSETEKWNYKTEMTIKELFNQPTDQPHRGILLLVRELEKILGKEKTLKLVAEIRAREKTQDWSEWAKTHPMTCFKDFVKLFESDVASLYSHANIDEPAVYTENSRSVKTVGCLFADTWRSWGASDVGYAYNCSTDFPTTKALSPKLRLERIKTLMQGDDCCDFKFVWDEEA